MADDKAPQTASLQTCCECVASPKTKQVLQAGSEYHLDVPSQSFGYGFGLPNILVTRPVALLVMCGNPVS
jgi:hypothetical protein